MSSNPPIHFVVSAPRSGSTWLTTALNGHPDVFATEHRLFGNFAEIWQNNDGSTSPRLTFDSYAKAFAVHYSHDQLDLNNSQFIETFQKSFVNFIVDFAMRRNDAKVVVDKITPYPGTADLVVEQIRKLLPESKIIQLVRDGRDVVTSGTFDWLLKDAEGTVRHRFFVDQDLSVRLDRFFDDSVMHKWATNWRETIEVFETKPADTQVSYENMHRHQPSELQKIFAVLGVSNDETTASSCAQSATFEKMSGRSIVSEAPTAKARKGAVGDWRNYFTRHDAELFVQLTGDCLVTLGYEADASWVDHCPAELGLTNA